MASMNHYFFVRVNKLVIIQVRKQEVQWLSSRMYIFILHERFSPRYLEVDVLLF